MEWIETLNGVMRMEELVAENNDTTEKFKRVWLTWLTFKDSPMLVDFLAELHRGLSSSMTNIKPANNEGKTPTPPLPFPLLFFY